MKSPEMSTPHEADRIARMPEVCAYFGLSPSTIRNRYTEGSLGYDPEFPKPRKLGPGRRCAIGWRVGDLYAYRDRQQLGMTAAYR
jgi:predicted DNA-binding transcriptional regulator AlpA